MSIPRWVWITLAVLLAVWILPVKAIFGVILSSLFSVFLALIVIAAIVLLVRLIFKSNLWND